MDREYQNYPVQECVDKARELIAEGATVYQKFTCEHCGQRLTMELPNTFYAKGNCDRCGKQTDILRSGCNYLVVFDRI